MSLTFYTSDTHLDHDNIIEYCNRPFKDVREMNWEIVRCWNRRVGPDDTVYHLGDFAFGILPSIFAWRKMLNGKVVLIRGNHDRNKKQMLEVGFDEVHNDLSVYDGNRLLFLKHKPRILDWQTFKELGGYDLHLCGHAHTRWKRHGDVINVGVDQWDFTPRTIEELVSA